MKYKHLFLPSDYQKIGKIVSDINEENLKEWGIVLKKPLTDTYINTITLENADDQKGTADLRITFKQKYSDLNIPISGFLTREQSFFVLINNDISNSSNIIVPSYLLANKDYVKDFVHDARKTFNFDDDPNDKINKDDINVDILFSNNESGVLIIEFTYNGKIASKLFRVNSDNTLIKHIMNSLKISEIKTKKYNEIETQFSTIDTAFDSAVFANYKYIKDLLLLNVVPNDTQSNVTYTLSYNKANISKTIDISSSYIKGHTQLLGKRTFNHINYLVDMDKITNDFLKNNSKNINLQYLNSKTFPHNFMEEDNWFMPMDFKELFFQTNSSSSTNREWKVYLENNMSQLSNSIVATISDKE